MERQASLPIVLRTNVAAFRHVNDSLHALSYHMSSHSSEKLTKQEMRQLLDTVEHTRDHDFERRVLADKIILQAHRCADERVVLEFALHAELYDNINEAETRCIEWAREIADTFRESPGGHLLSGMLAINDRFPEDAPQLASSLAARLGVDDSIVDGTVSSLSAIDRALESMYSTTSLTGELYTAVVAYLGVVASREFDAVWEMRRSEKHHDIWEPWLRLPNGRKVDIWRPLATRVIEREPLSILVIFAFAFDSYPNSPASNGPGG